MTKKEQQQAALTVRNSFIKAYRVDGVINILQEFCDDRAAQDDGKGDKRNSKKWLDALILLQETKEKIAKLHLPE